MRLVMLRDMTRPRKNPFRPGPGVLPPLLAGRDAELALAEQRLAELAEGVSPPQDLLFYGPRGNGKTTLLIEIESRARDRRLRIESLPTHALVGIERLVRELHDQTGRLKGQVTGVSIAGFGGAATPNLPTENIARLLASWVAADAGRPLVIVLDEAQAMPPEVGAPLFEGVQQVKGRGAPLLMFAAGTPEAPRRIRQAVTFTERGFVETPVGRLSRTDTMRALTEPARAAGRPVADDAAALLAEQSQDYPFFIQLLGRAAWDAAARASSDGGISLRAAQEAAIECREVIECFYADRYEEAETRRIEAVLQPLARLFGEHDGRVPHSALKTRLREFSESGSVPLDDLALRQELSDLGVVWSAEPGVWEMGIPSFADYLLRRP